MKQSILCLFLLICIFPYNLFGQKLSLKDSSEILKYYFPISADDAESMLQQKKMPSDWKWDFDKAISIPTKTRGHMDSLDYGQYISAAYNNSNISKGKINHEIISKHSFTVNILQDGNEVYVILMDLDGNKIQVDKIIYKGKSLVFNGGMQGYLLRKPKRYDEIRIWLDNQYAIYRLSKKPWQSKWTIFKTKPIGKILITYPKKAIVGFFKLFKKRKKYISNGYIVLNQPKYQLLDTVKTSAYFVHKHNGKPYEKPIRMIVGIPAYYKGGYYRDTLIDRKIYPIYPGRYNYDFVIGDSVKIDKDYVVSYQFGNKKKKYKNYYENKRLYVEDYELDEVTYSFDPTQTKYKKDEKIILRSSAKYTTGKRVPDVDMELLVLPFTMGKFLKDELILPDTIWKHQQTLDYDDVTQIVIPDSLVPDATMALRLKATFNTIDGELQTKEEIIYINQESEIENKETLLFMYKNGKIKGRLMLGDSSLNSTAKLITYFVDSYNNVIKKIEEVKLPFEKEVSINAQRYILTDKGGEERYILMNHNFDGISIKRNITRDSFQFTIDNPLKHKINYQLFYENKLLEKGNIVDDRFEYKAEMLGYGNYKLLYGYVWGGESRLKERTFNINPNQLNITLEQPEETEPGKEIDVKIIAKDQDGNPARNVAITASALSTKFKSNISDVTKTPSYPNVKRKKILPHYTFDANRNQKSRKKYSAKNTLWEDKLQLETSRKYRLAHPEKGHYTEYVPLPKEMDDFPQFAPFVISEGRAKKIYAIYADRRPIYFYDTEGTDFSFILREGFHNIEIRTKKARYQIDSVELKKGQKLFLSIDEEKAQDGQLKNVRYKSAKKKWLKAETRSRQNSLMILDDYGSNYIWERNGEVTSLSYGGGLIGPFTRGSMLNIARDYHFKKTFFFEPGYKYRIMENRERLYEYSFKKRDEKTKFWQEYDKIYISDLAMTPSQIQYKSPAEKNKEPFSKLYHDDRFTKYEPTKLKIENNIKNPLLLVLIDAEAMPFLFSPSKISSFIGEMPEGKYELLVFYKDGYISKNISLQNNATTYVRLIKKSLTVKGFKEKAKAVFGDMFDWENSIFNEDEKMFFGILEEAEKDYFLNKIEAFKMERDSIYLLGLNDEERAYYEHERLRQEVEILRKLEAGNARKRSEESRMVLNEVVVARGGGRIRRKQKSTSSGWTLNKIIPEASRNEVRFEDRAEYEKYARENDLFMETDDGNQMIDYSYMGMLSGNPMDEDNFNTEAYLAGEYGSSITQGYDSLLIYKPSLNFDNTQLRQNFSDYAYWQNNLITDENGETYFSAVLPDDITGWTSYAIGMDNQQRHGVVSKEFFSFKKVMAQLSIPRFAVEGDEFEVIGQSTNYTQDSFQIKTEFLLDEDIIYSNESLLKNNNVDKTLIKISSEKDSLDITYRLVAENSSDGEKRPLKINKQGTIESKGEFNILKNNDKIDFKAPLDAPIKIAIQDNKMDMLMASLEQLKKYEYGCNEQTASKLIALLLEKDIKEKMGEKFKGERKILKAISKLEKSQNEDGSWGWWSENEAVNWITLYATEALQMAANMGYKTKIENSLNFIARRQHTFAAADQLKAIHILQQDGTAVDSTDIMKNDTMELSVPEFLLFNIIKQKAGYETDLDSIQKMMATTTYGGQHITADKKYWYYDDMNSTLLAYDIFNAAKDSSRVEAIENYFYKNRTQYGWTSTIHAAQILKRLLSDAPALKSDSKISINGKEIKTFPYQTELDTNEVSISHTGVAPHFVSIYQEQHIRQPKEKTDVFEVKTVFKQENQIVEELKKAKATQLEVTINAKEEGDYIMIETPIPSGCSYGKKIQDKSKGIENHREYHKDKVLIFCSRLPEGENTFTIHLEPRYTGKFVLNPIKVEEMYAPNIFGRNEVGDLKIE